MSAKSIPEPPTHINQVTERKTIDGRPMIYTIVDEIIRVPKSNPRKAIYLQMLEHEPAGRREMRVCYFMVSVKGRTKGRWVFAQFAPLIGQKDFEFLICQARQKGWVTC